MPILDRLRLDGKVAVVTGGEGLLGKAICEMVEELGGQAVSLDIATPEHVAGVDVTKYSDLEKVAKNLPKVDILVNCAVGNQKPVLLSFTGWQDDIDIGLTGTINAMQAFSGRLNDSKGVVLNIGSDLSLIAPDHSLYPKPMKKPASYSAVKHAIVGLTRYYAATWAPDIRVNCLCPGGIDVGQTVPRCPMNRLAKIEEITSAAAFLISDASSYCTGSVMVVDGGRTAI